MKIVISSGHGKYVRGASGYLDEVDEARRVVDRVAELMRGVDVEATTFHDNTSTSQNENLNTIVNFHNSQARDLDISVHFNAYQMTTKPMGTEVLYVTQQALADEVAAAIAGAAGFIDRGPKKRTDLFFLNNTSEPAILIETCFVDSEIDADLYNTHFADICQAVAEAITDREVGEPEEPEQPPPEEAEVPHVTIDIKATGSVLITINGQDFMVQEPGPESVTKPEFPANQQNITATTFGGGADPNNSAYEPYDPITDQEISCALPARLADPRPMVEVLNAANGKSAICRVRDIGPWNTDDPYWDTGTRPQAETGTDKKGRDTNSAGLDLTPAAAHSIGLEGKGKVHWRFI